MPVVSMVWSKREPAGEIAGVPRIYNACGSCTYGTFRKRCERRCEQAALTNRQDQAMLMLRGRQDGPQVSIDDLAQELLVKHSSAVGLVDRLAAPTRVARKTERAVDDLQVVTARFAQRASRERAS